MHVCTVGGWRKCPVSGLTLNLYGDLRMGNYAYGDTRLDFPCMHTVSDWNIPVCILRSQIPVCIRGLRVMRSPYEYGDLCDLHMQTCNPRMHIGIHLIPVRIRGLIFAKILIHCDACKNSDSTRDSRKDRWHIRNYPCTHTGSPHMRTYGDTEKFAYGESPYA
jgi:hypothetical protein